MGWVTGDPDSTALLAIAQAGFNTVLFGTSDTAATLAPVLENVNADGLKAIVSFKASILQAACNRGVDYYIHLSGSGRGGDCMVRLR